MRLTIEGCSAKEAALFLRFLYSPNQITAASMGKLGDDLPAVGPASRGLLLLQRASWGLGLQVSAPPWLGD